jgi:tocopherol cyclase
MRLIERYRATGADLPYGDPLPAHGVAMEGYFWRVSDPASGRVVIALIGVNRGPSSSWATLGLASWPEPGLSVTAAPDGWADPIRLGARSGTAFVADHRSIHVDLGPGARLDLTIDEPQLWPRRRYGGSSGFHSVPRLNQYWHPWLLGGRANGTATVGGQTWDVVDAQVYGEKNWGAEGFPAAWWWGQAHGFEDREACVAFAGGRVTAGPLRTEVTAVVVRLPDGTVVRLGNPGSSPVRAEVTDERWHFRGAQRRLRGGGWSIEVEGRAPLGAAHVLPVPLPSEGRNTAGAIEHLGGQLSVTVRHGGAVVWEGHSTLAGLEHGGLARAEAELRRRGVEPAAVAAAGRTAP